MQVIILMRLLTGIGIEVRFVCERSPGIREFPILSPLHEEHNTLNIDA